VFFRKSHVWTFVCWTTGDGDRLKTYGDVNGLNLEVVAPEYVCAVRVFFTAMNCKNVVAKEVVHDAKLQKAREKRGKKPLFSFWTLELKQEKTEKCEGYGGTHNSPRLHLRRGHPREYAPGKWTWVQPCAVGNKALGLIHKDYRMGGDQ